METSVCKQSSQNKTTIDSWHQWLSSIQKINLEIEWKRGQRFYLFPYVTEQHTSLAAQEKEKGQGTWEPQPPYSLKRKRIVMPKQFLKGLCKLIRYFIFFFSFLSYFIVIFHCNPNWHIVINFEVKYILKYKLHKFYS